MVWDAEKEKRIKENGKGVMKKEKEKGRDSHTRERERARDRERESERDRDRGVYPGLIIVIHAAGRAVCRKRRLFRSRGGVYSLASWMCLTLFGVGGCMTLRVCVSASVYFSCLVFFFFSHISYSLLSSQVSISLPIFISRRDDLLDDESELDCGAVSSS